MISNGRNCRAVCCRTRTRYPDRRSRRVVWQEICNERLPGSEYAILENCRYEINEAEKIMCREGICWMSSTTKSIEEIAATILQEIKPDQKTDRSAQGLLPDLLEKTDGRACSYIQRFDIAQMRNGNFVCGQFQQLGCNTLSFMPEQPGNRLGQIKIV